PDVGGQIALFGREPVPSAHAESVYDTNSAHLPSGATRAGKRRNSRAPAGGFPATAITCNHRDSLCLLWFGLLIRAGLPGGEWASASGAERCWTAPSES